MGGIMKVKWYGDWEELKKLGEHNCVITQCVDNIMVIDIDGNRTLVWPGDELEVIDGVLVKV